MSGSRPLFRPLFRPLMRPLFPGEAWSPLSLFSNGEQGAWYDPSDLSTLYQNAAGTTPVTADGDPVGLMLDKSGNGNHASQSVAASRPIYPGLAYDGVDDWIDASQCVLAGTQRTLMFVMDTATIGENSAAMGWATNSSGTTATAWFYVRTTFGSANEQIRLLVGTTEVLVGPDIRNTGTRTVGIRQDGANWDLLIDGEVYVSSAFGYSAPIENITLGRSPNVPNPRWLSGKLGRFVASTAAWTDQQCKDVSNYLLSGGAL